MRYRHEDLFCAAPCVRLQVDPENVPVPDHITVPEGESPGGVGLPYVAVTRAEQTVLEPEATPEGSQLSVSVVGALLT